MEFTPDQKKVINARGHNVLVSAAAGSGKTAVLVERIIQMVTDSRNPLDLDRLLVVTFTRSAAAQMRERIGNAIAERLKEDPYNRHLQRQETLLHHAQITTIDSFCTFLLRGGFSEIDLDPGFRQIDETQNTLLETKVLGRFLEEQYEKKEASFLACVDYFCPEGSDRELETLITRLDRVASSHPYPDEWLLERKKDYAPQSVQEVLESAWYREYLEEKESLLTQAAQLHRTAYDIAGQPDGPYPYLEVLEKEQNECFGFLLEQPYRSITDSFKLRESLLSAGEYFNEMQVALPRIYSKKNSDIDPDKKEAARDLRKKARDILKGLCEDLAEETQEIFSRMRSILSPADALIDLVLEYQKELQKEKKKQNVINFSDLEHYALQILIKKDESGKLHLRKSAASYREYFQEILIDEYQDSNEVQELLLRAIAGECDADLLGGEKDKTRYARFMVGDVKQSIYKFRNARPEIFEEKYDTYKLEDPKRELIHLDRNFRSRTQVLDAVNGVFTKIMRREIGGVEYNDTVSLKPGAVYPLENDSAGEDPYQCELLLVETGGEGKAQPEGDPALDEIASYSAAKKEALSIAQRIRQMVGVLPITDPDTGRRRPAKYADIVILLRSTSSRQDAYREVFEKEGIPLYMEYTGGYFEAEEIRCVLQMLRVIDNPRQDIPLYGAMRGYFGGFLADEIGAVRALGLSENFSEKDALLYESLLLAADDGASDGKTDALSPGLKRKCQDFLAFLQKYRRMSQVSPIHELIGDLIRTSGYENYVRALPAGLRRSANLHALLVKAKDFEQTGYAGLFLFLRFIDAMHDSNVDYGEAGILDEKADVVRLSTIHKSKGLEYPICFVSCLSTRFAYLRDLNGSFLLDEDMGMGIAHMDVSLRRRVETPRQSAVASRIRRDSLGEELRVLYVAMTRAKEKLILTASVKEALSQINNASLSVSSLTMENGHLPVFLIRSATSFLSLLLWSIEAMKKEKRMPILVKAVSLSDLQLKDLEDQMTLGELKNTLLLTEQEPLSQLPDPDLAKELTERFSYRYPYANMEGLYTKTSVSELKHAAMVEAGILEEPSPGAAELYPDNLFHENKEDHLPKPLFAQEGMEGQQGMGPLTGAERGTAVHRMCELIDYRAWKEPARVSEEMFNERVDVLLGKGAIPASYRSVLTPELFLPFLQSQTAKRMADAARKDLLRREQPFVLGISANRLNSDFPKEETILIQGIIDAFFIEGEKENRHIVLVDYKTDRIQKGIELIERYKTQLDYYAEALSSMLRLPVSQRILYSFHLQEEVFVDPGDGQNG